MGLQYQHSKKKPIHTRGLMKASLSKLKLQSLVLDSWHQRAFYVLQLLSHTPTVLQFLLLQSEQRLDNEIKLQEKNRRVLRCLLSWVSACTFVVLNCIVVKHYEFI